MARASAVALPDVSSPGDGLTRPLRYSYNLPLVPRAPRELPVTPASNTTAPHSIGLGLRRRLVEEWRDLEQQGYGNQPRPEFIEVTPENWMGLGGKFRRNLAYFTERYPVYAHGLSLSIGGPTELDMAFVDRLKTFLDDCGVIEFSEHLSYCTDHGHLYDLMPIPFTEAAVQRVCERILRVQDRLKRQIALENVSFYAMPAPEMTEAEFICAVLERADCKLLLDINNVWVNSVNHGYDPKAFIEAMPGARVAYQHIAGHLQISDRQIIDTHGTDVSDPVWDLLAHAQATLGPRPTVLERDGNFPPLSSLLGELAEMGHILNGTARGTPGDAPEEITV